jgi:hypothetical protein
LESQNKLPEDGYWKDFYKLIRDFRESGRNFILNFLHKYVSHCSFNNIGYELEKTKAQRSSMDFKNKL